MENFSFEGITATVILDKRRHKQNLLYPIKYRITYQQKQVYYPCMDLTVEDWESLPTTRKKELLKTRSAIQTGFKKITGIIVELVNNNGFTFAVLNKMLSKGTEDSIIDAFDYKIEKLKKEKHIGSSVWYSCALNSIKKFENKGLKFADITPDWLKKYETHLLDEGKTYTTISMYMRALRAIINDAKTDGIISQAQYPFVLNSNGKYQIPEGTGRKLALTSSQLIAVFNYPIIPQEEIWRDLWVFSFYCNGINLNDLLRLKFKNIIDGEIVWFRQKTINQDKKKKEIRALITNEMKVIMNRGGNHDKQTDNYIFPYLTSGLSAIDQRKIIQNVTHTINKKMKKIGRALGYGDITTYSARHSFATVLKRGGANIASISESMGHANSKTTESYFDSFGKEERIKNAELLPKRT